MTKGIKKDWTTILGFISFAGTIFALFADMFLSTNPDYSFEMKWYYIAGGLVFSIALIVMDQNQVKKLITKFINKKIDG